MNFPFDLTEDATADLEEVVETLSEANQRAALKVADDLEHAFRFLADWPGAGHRRHDLTDVEDVRFWTSGKYMIVYLQARTPLLIIAVLHGARDIASILPPRLDRL